jgi:hypothetical protein
VRHGTARQEYELESPVGSEHSAINKAMLAAALDPLAFARRDDEPVLDMPQL